MSFDSLSYLVFLPVVCVLHYLTPARFRWVVLLLSSFIFYASWNAALSLLIFSVILLSYGAGLLLERVRAPHFRRAILLGSLFLLLGLLGYFKYFNMLGRTAALLFGVSWQVRDILLPVGVSFYTFQAISYVADVYRGTMKAERHFGYYALYISFFPQLVAGPIERASALLPQLRAKRDFHREDMLAGFQLLVCGFFRKLVVADLLAPFVNIVYQASAPDGSAVLLATLLFAVQIYCDFSGYSQIAAGSARLLGIHLMRNFDRPYGAKNIREFWRRWHISLTVWFTDYVYIPLGGSRRGLFRQLLATLAVFLLCGLWHGAEWSFVVWGLLHALGMGAYPLWRRHHPGRKSSFLSLGLTLCFVCFSWLFFRAGSMSRAFLLLGQLFSRWQINDGIALVLSAAKRGMSSPVFAFLLLGLLLVLCRLPRQPEERQVLPAVAWAGLLLAIVLAVWIRMDSGLANAFLYFQF